MQPLNLPACPLTIRKQNNRLFVFDTQRKRYVALTPEEWVRQHFIHYLTDCLGYPAARLAVEHQIALNGMKKRCDAVLFDTDARPLLIVEVKAPIVPITQAVFDQVAVYNLTLGVQFFMVSNGLEHYCCRVDRAHNRYDFLPALPTYEELISLTSPPTSPPTP